MTEFTTIKIARYRDPAGLPTCAANFNTRNVCRFYATRKLGQDEICLIAGDKIGKHPESISRRADSNGSLVPLKDCPVWPATEKLDFPPFTEGQK